MIVAARMVAVLGQLGLADLVCSIDGLSPVGAASILAETGDLSRFTSARAVVKLAGLAPRERKSGTFAGKGRLSGAGRPRLPVAAWRAVWDCLQNNQLCAVRYRHPTSRETNRLTPTQAQTSSPPRSCGSCTPSSPPAKPGTRTWPPTACGRPNLWGSLRRNPIRVKTARVISQVGASLPRH
jgi:hypothetical protein